MTNMLITPITEEGTDEIRISGRQLHMALDVDTPYRKWFPRMCEYGFTEGVDFNPDKNVHVQNEGNRAIQREITDHHMTLSMAKEIAMLQRTEKGKEVRRYFIQLEEDWNTPEKVVARALVYSNKMLADARAQLTAATERIALDAPKVRFAESVADSEGTILIRELAKILKQNGYETGEQRLYAQLRQEGYLISNRKAADYNTPTQRAAQMGLFVIKKSVITTASGETRVQNTTKVTGKGQVYFVNRYCGVKA